MVCLGFFDGRLGKKQSLCDVKMIVLSLECVALLYELRMVYSFFKLYKMHEMEFFNCASILKELKM